jgi:hypothetical protein
MCAKFTVGRRSFSLQAAAWPTDLLLAPAVTFKGTRGALLVPSVCPSLFQVQTIPSKPNRACRLEPSPKGDQNSHH